MRQYGRRSSHYACDMTNIDQTFVITVADNLRQDTMQKVDQTKVTC